MSLLYEHQFLNLEASLKNDMHLDIIGDDLFMELIFFFFENQYHKNFRNLLKYLIFLKKIDDCYQITYIVYHIFFTITAK